MLFFRVFRFLSPPQPTDGLRGPRELTGKSQRWCLGGVLSSLSWGHTQPSKLARDQRTLSASRQSKQSPWDNYIPMSLHTLTHPCCTGGFWTRSNDTGIKSTDPLSPTSARTVTSGALLQKGKYQGNVLSACIDIQRPSFKSQRFCLFQVSVH